MNILVAIASSTAIIPASQYPNIIVVGDVHGDAEALLLSLYSGYAEVVENESENPVSFDEFRLRFDQVIGTQTLHKLGPLWNQKNVAVVQLGDLIDRGRFSLQCLLIMRAVRAVLGFEVFQILGNHELAPAIDVGAQYTQYRHPADDLDWAGQSMNIHKPWGLLYTEVLSRFLPFARLDGGSNREISTLFVHAGVPLDFITDSQTKNPFTPNELVRYLNLIIKKDLMTNETPKRRLIKKYITKETIFTTRMYKRKFPDCKEIKLVLDLFQVSRIVVGHIADFQNHRSRNIFCDGKPVIVLADIAASRYMGGFDRDNERPFPGSIFMQIDTANNALISMEGIYTDHFGNKINAARHSLLSTRSSTIPVYEIQKIGPVLYTDAFVQIGYFKSDNRVGLILEMTNDSLTRAQPALSQLEETRDNGLLDEMMPVFEHIQIDGKQYWFIESQDRIPMIGYPRALSSRIINQMEDFINMLNDEGICVGVVRDAEETQLADPHSLRQLYLRLFFISVNGRSITLVNFSQLHVCEDEQDELESDIFIDVFAKHLGI